jgi:hypothetical protein
MASPAVRERIDAFDGPDDVNKENEPEVWDSGLVVELDDSTFVPSPHPAFTVSFRQSEEGPVVWYGASSVFATSESMRMYEATLVGSSSSSSLSSSGPWPARGLLRVMALPCRLASWNLVSTRVPPHKNIMRSIPCLQGEHIHLMERGGSDLFELMWMPDTAGSQPRGLTRLMGMGVAGDIASALLHMHSHGVCHRDVKPENVVVSTDGTPKLVDFDFASDKKLISLSRFSGTLRYVPHRLFVLLRRMARVKSRMAMAGEPGEDLVREYDDLKRRVYNPFEVDIFGLCVMTVDLLVRDSSWGSDTTPPKTSQFEGPVGRIRQLFGSAVSDALWVCIHALTTDSLHRLAETLRTTHLSLMIQATAKA